MSELPTLGLIVEGHGDVRAAPILVRRILEARGVWPTVLPAHRVAKSKMPLDLNRAVRLQLSRVGTAGGVLVLLDADSDDPIELGEALLGRIDEDLAVRCRIAIAVKEFEAWFLGDLPSLRSHKSVLDGAAFAGDPETPRDAKGRLAEQMHEGYQETIHQAAFSSLIDLESVAGRSPSFAQFSACVIELSQMKS